MAKVFSSRYFIIGLMIALSAISAADLIVDHNEGASLSHMFHEGLVFILCLVAVAQLLRELRQQKLNITSLRGDLEHARQEVARASESVKDGRLAFSRVIAEQFETWALSKSEREVALLLLKGLSLSEIASLRDTKDKTVRQQASAIYKKAGVSGRHAFAAWFIEDVL